MLVKDKDILVEDPEKKTETMWKNPLPRKSRSGRK